jgi:hypothetical protein
MNKKKLAAAVSAVTAYIKTEEEAAMYHAMTAPAETASPVPGNQPVLLNFSKPNTWGMIGRMSQMQVRSMMQLRMFK